MSWGLIVRCDQGGLGNQTLAMWRHMRPDRALLVRVEDPRGDEYPDDYQEGRGLGDALILPRTSALTEGMVSTWADGLDRVVAVESLYGRAFDRLPVETLVVSNPELYGPGDSRIDRVVVPTPWELDRMPAGTPVLPHPVEDAIMSSWRRVGPKEREECRTLLHPWAPAMLDRNGTEAVMKALRYVTEPVRLVVRAPGRPSPRGVVCWTDGLVSVEWDDSREREWWECYSYAADVLVLPRRFGGLCLPAQEAAALGMPALMTDLSPQREWPAFRCGTLGGKKVMMKGGAFAVHRPDHVDLARVISRLAADDSGLVAEMSRRAMAWARSISWDALRNDWLRLCAST